MLSAAQPAQRDSRLFPSGLVPWQSRRQFRRTTRLDLTNGKVSTEAPRPVGSHAWAGHAEISQLLEPVIGQKGAVELEFLKKR
jgi:hypothetical protein